MRSIRSVAMAFPLAVVVFASVGVVSPLSVAAAPCATSTSGGVTTVTFCSTGAAQTWTVPAGVHSVKFTLSGAAGGAGTGGVLDPGGLGGKAVATVAVVPGSTVTIVIGGVGATPDNPDGCGSNAGAAGGFNGGAAGGNGGGGECGGSGGGGATDVRIGGNALANRVLVAGGGGGGTGDHAGGAGGGSVGVAGGGTGPLPNHGGGGGTQAAGGAAGTGDSNGSAGVSGAGGAGASNCGRGGGGGGGGFFGGGGGAADECGVGGGGGGGSAHGPAGRVLTAGVRAGAGLVVISYTTPLPAASASAPSVPWLPIGGLAIGFALIWFGMRRRRATAA